MLVALLHPVVLGAALRIQGTLTCPEPAQVSVDLQRILDVAAEYAPQLNAVLTRNGQWLDLTLTGADGTSLGERRFDANEDCAALSHTVAVVLATWLSDEHPEYLVALPTSDPSVVAAAGAPDDAAAPVIDQAAPAALPPPLPPLPPPLPPPSSKSRTLISAQSARPNDAKPYRLAPSAAFGGAVSSAGLAPAAWLGVSLDPRGAGLGAELTAAWVGKRKESLATHEVRWSRWPMLLGPYFRTATKIGRFDLGAGAAFGLLQLEGQNFAPNIASAHAAFGSYAALRFLPSAGAWQPFFTVAPVFWFSRATAIASGGNGDAPEATLPSLDVLFAVGLRFLP